MSKTVFVGLSPVPRRYASATGQAGGKGRTVFVGLSGGVDSAVSAGLLKEQGYNVVGVFIKIWQPEFFECTWAKDRVDAMRVAVALGIPFREIDLSEEYKKNVVEEMVGAYKAGITPNPDVLCNRHIKFGSFLEYAIREGADYIATGHYARVEEASGVFKLLRGIDTSKDQSYFLYTLGQSDLSHTFFPVGGFEKKQVRGMARKFNLPVAEKPDSQGLCFVGDVTMRDFLARYIKLERGEVLDTKGTTIGEHEGTALYTIGQRHGFSVTRSGKEGPFYVTAIDASRNTIVVSPAKNDAGSMSVRIGRITWTGKKPAMPLACFVQARYRETPCEALAEEKNGELVVSFSEARIASPGQSLVMYDQHDACLGGGTIIQTHK